MRAPELKPLRHDQPFCANGKRLDFDLLDYWCWSGSDLLGNTERGVVAEFLVAKTLDVVDKVRREWTECDVVFDDIKIEVKSAAYRQSWAQDKNKVPKINFSIAKTQESWKPETGKITKHDPPKRIADVYVFCVLGTKQEFKDEKIPDPLNTDEWSFYVLDTASLPDQKTISLSSLQRRVKDAAERGAVKYGGAVKYADLREAIRDRFA